VRVDGMSTSSAGEQDGDSGKGVDDGDSGCCSVELIGDGDALAEASGVVALEASPIAKVARSLSSRFVLGSLVSLSGGMSFALLSIGPGLPDRLVAKDFRRLDKADSANWPEDRGEDWRNACKSEDLG
jgi:hypothetical protein